MRFTLKNLRFLQYIDYQNVRKTEFLGCQSQDESRNRDFHIIRTKNPYIFHIFRDVLRGIFTLSGFMC